MTRSSPKMNASPAVKRLVNGLTASKWQSQGETPGPFLPSPVHRPTSPLGEIFYYIPKQSVVRENSGNMTLSPDSSTIYLIATNKSLGISRSTAACPLSIEVYFGSSKAYAIDQKTMGQKAPVL